MKIKTVIFDFDGTIADTLPKILQLYNQYAKDFKLRKIDRNEVEILRNKTPWEILRFFGISAIKIPFIANRIRKELNNSITSIKAFPEIKKILYLLNKEKFQLGVLTTNSKENVEKFLNFNKIDFFDFIYSDSNLFSKSNSLEKLLFNYKLDKKKTVYIGDEVRDVEACKENGIKIISVTWGFNKKEILEKNHPDYLIDKPNNILKILGINKE